MGWEVELEHHTGFIGGLTRNKTTGTAHLQHFWQSRFGASYRLHWWAHTQQNYRYRAFSNTCGAKLFEEFLAGMGWEVELEHNTGSIGGLTRNKTTSTAHFQHMWQPGFLRSLWPAWAVRWSWIIIQASVVRSHAIKQQIQRIFQHLWQSSFGA
jgi:hypothetical protein